MLKPFYTSENVENIQQITIKENEETAHKNIYLIKIIQQSDLNSEEIRAQSSSDIRKHSLRKHLKRTTKGIPKENQFSLLQTAETMKEELTQGKRLMVSEVSSRMSRPMNCKEGREESGLKRENCRI